MQIARRTCGLNEDTSQERPNISLRNPKLLTQRAPQCCMGAEWGPSRPCCHPFRQAMPALCTESRQLSLECPGWNHSSVHQTWPYHLDIPLFNDLGHW